MAVKKTVKKAAKPAAKSSSKAKAPAKKAAPAKKSVVAKKAVKPVAKAAKAAKVVKAAAKPVAKAVKKAVKAPVKAAKKPVVAKAPAKKAAPAKPVAKAVKPLASKAQPKKAAPVAKKAPVVVVKKVAPAKPAPVVAVKTPAPAKKAAPAPVVAKPAPAPAPPPAPVAPPAAPKTHVKKGGRKQPDHASLAPVPRVPTPPRERPTGKTLIAKTPSEKKAPKASKVKVVKYEIDRETKRPILPAGYKPSVDEEYMNPLHIEYFRQKLLDRRAALVAESKQTIESLKEEVRDVGDDAERASRETENALELRERDRNRKMIGKLDSILRRIDSGDYGYCVDTGEEIGLERLEARPEAERTLDAQGRREHLQRQFSD